MENAVGMSQENLQARAVALPTGCSLLRRTTPCCIPSQHVAAAVYHIAACFVALHPLWGVAFAVGARDIRTCSTRMRPHLAACNARRAARSRQNRTDTAPPTALQPTALQPTNATEAARAGDMCQTHATDTRQLATRNVSGPGRFGVVAAGTPRRSRRTDCEHQGHLRPGMTTALTADSCPALALAYLRGAGPCNSATSAPAPGHICPRIIASARPHRCHCTAQRDSARCNTL